MNKTNNIKGNGENWFFMAGKNDPAVKPFIIQ